MIPREERMDLHVNPKVKQAAVERADRDGQSLNELGNDALCLYLGLDPASHQVERKPPGRKPGAKPKGRPRKRRD